MTNLIKDRTSKLSKNSKEKAISAERNSEGTALPDVDPKIDKPTKEPVLIIKDPAAIKDPVTAKTPVGDPSLPEDTKQPLDAKQPLSDDKGSSFSKLPGDRKPVMGDGEKDKDSNSGLYGSKQPTTGDKQESAGAAGAQLGATGGAGLPIGGSSLGLVGAQSGGAGLPIGGSSLGLAGAQSGGAGLSPKGSSLKLAGARLVGTGNNPLRPRAQQGITSGAVPGIVGVALTSLQVTGGAAAYASAGGVSTGDKPPIQNPLYGYTQNTPFGNNQRSFDATDALIGISSLGTLDSLTHHELSDLSLSSSSLTIDPIGNGVLTDPNPILNSPSSFTYAPNLGESTGSISPLTGINLSGGSILPPSGLPNSIVVISESGGGFSQPIG